MAILSVIWENEPSKNCRKLAHLVDETKERAYCIYVAKKIDNVPAFETYLLEEVCAVVTVSRAFDQEVKHRFMC